MDWISDLPLFFFLSLSLFFGWVKILVWQNNSNYETVFDFYAFKKNLPNPNLPPLLNCRLMQPPLCIIAPSGPETGAYRWCNFYYISEFAQVLVQAKILKFYLITRMHFYVSQINELSDNKREKLKLLNMRRCQWNKSVYNFTIFCA